VVNCVDTTGAGDVFHGAFCYAVLQGMPMREALDFSNAMAALNCTALGARGGIRGLSEVRALMARAERRSHPEFAAHTDSARGGIRGLSEVRALMARAERRSHPEFAAHTD